MTPERPPVRSSQPSLLDIYHVAQQIQYGDKPPVQAKVAEGERARRDPSQLVGRAGAEIKKHPLRYGVAGLAAFSVLAFTFQARAAAPSAEAPLTPDKNSTVVTGIQVGKVEQGVTPTGDPEKMTFSSLLGDHVDLGTLSMATVGGTGQIVFKRSDGTMGTIALPNMSHRQNIELSAQPLLAQNEAKAYVPTSPLTVAQKDGSYVVHVDRSKVAIVLNYAMPGTYTAHSDTKSKTTSVSLTTTDSHDASTISFLPTTSTPLSATEAGLMTPIEKGRVNALATATDKMATIEAKIMSLKQSIDYIKSSTTNTCYANPSDPNPAGVDTLIRQKVDTVFKRALDKWASDNHRTLSIDMEGEYPLNSATALAQYAANAAGGDTATKESARDLQTIMTNPYASYFSVAPQKTICIPDETLKDSK